jgi:hypothetical protein
LRALAATGLSFLLLAASLSCSSPTNHPAPLDAQADAPRDVGAEALDAAPPGTDAGARNDGAAVDAQDAAGALPFGATCVSNSDCQTTLCFLFGKGTSHCTQPCSSNADCPAGSQGQKCNGKGTCAY